jgi:2-polyprenyl-3-methyl-5-hydroxy-6-metoxy-1,4-benzoquinol methylase
MLQSVRRPADFDFLLGATGEVKPQGTVIQSRANRQTAHAFHFGRDEI